MHERSQRHPFLPRPTLLPLWGILFLSPLLLSGCLKKKSEVPTPVQESYQRDADRYCRAIVDCMKEELAGRLKESPERKEMVLKRMDRDLCIKEQYHLIGALSHPSEGGAEPFDPEPYRIYSRCSKAVAEAPDCSARREVHKTNADCIRLRKIESP